ncbi:hypothetical protein BJY04DRAFT_216419 [Aspergillus karnatakaensis]|uniref:uncharacterized protein n=1 Tax=Aspergillus karnatakaensis TaxID=1810916 RepID=UPI003CCD9CEF
MSTAQDSNFDLAIVGGGIAGLCLALAIKTHTNIPVTLYEAAPAFGEIGAGVAFGPNAVRALSFISPAFREGFSKIATGNLDPAKQSTWFDFRVGVDGPDEDARARGVKAGMYLGSVTEPEPHSGLVNRARLLDVLVDLLPAGFGEFSKVLSGLEDRGDGVVLRFEDGTHATHSAVVGCDGIKSRIRPVLLPATAVGGHPASRATFTGKYCYRGMIPMDVAVSKLGAELARPSRPGLSRV